MVGKCFSFASSDRYFRKVRIFAVHEAITLAESNAEHRHLYGNLWTTRLALIIVIIISAEHRQFLARPPVLRRFIGGYANIFTSS